MLGSSIDGTGIAWALAKYKIKPLTGRFVRIFDFLSVDIGNSASKRHSA
jgi:hypothetical protein